MKNTHFSRFWAMGLLMVVLLVAFSSCKDRNAPYGGGGSSSYSGYAPTLAGMQGRWLDIGIMMKFRYNGSSWDVSPSDIATYLQNKDLQVSSGHISYSRVDDYTALLEFNIVYSYKASSSSSRTTATFKGSSIILDFNSSTGGTWNGIIGSSTYTNRRFTLSY
jgi:hypothetical protein